MKKELPFIVASNLKKYFFILFYFLPAFAFCKSPVMIPIDTNKVTLDYCIELSRSKSPDFVKALSDYRSAALDYKKSIVSG